MRVATVEPLKQARAWRAPGGRWLTGSLLLVSLGLLPAPVGTGSEAVERFAQIRALGFQARLVDYSPDGRRLAAETAGVIRLVDAETWAVEDRQLLSESRIMCLAWSPAGRYLATGHNRGNVPAEITLWDLEDGGRPRRLKGHDRRVNAVAWSPDGTRLASVSNDGWLQVWAVETGELVYRTGGGLNAVAWSPDGEIIATGTLSGLVLLIEAATGARLGELRGHGSNVLALAWRPDSRYLASGTLFGDVRVWEPAAGRLVRILTAEAGAEALEWSPDGTWLAAAVGGIRLWEPIVTGTLVRRLGAGQINALTWHPDGQRLVSGGLLGVLQVWDPLSGALERTLFDGHDGPAYGVSWSPDARWVASAGGYLQPTVKIWEVEAGQSVHTLQPAGCTILLTGVAWSPDGETLASSGCGGVVLWDPESGTERGRLPAGGPSWSPDSRRVATLVGTRTVRIWEVATGQAVVDLDAEHQVAGLAWSPDGQWLAAGLNRQPWLPVWETGGWTKVRTLEARNHAQWPAWSPDGRCLAAADGTTVGASDLITVWEVASAEVTATLRREGKQGERFTSPTWSPSGRYVAAAYRAVPAPGANIADFIGIWDVGEETQVTRLVGHTDVIYWIQWSPDGRYLASASQDTTVRLWGERIQGTMIVRAPCSVNHAPGAPHRPPSTRHQARICIPWSVPRAVFPVNPAPGRAHRGRVETRARVFHERRPYQR